MRHIHRPSTKNQRTILLSNVLILLLSIGAAVVQSEQLLYSSPGRQKISLNSPDVAWVLRRSDDVFAVPGSVPGDVYSSLRQAGAIPDPTSEFNDVRTRWVSSYNWTYEAKFFVNYSVIAAAPSVDLVLDGVDTIGTVTLNGQILVEACDSHWREYRVSVKKLLAPGGNTLSVALSSPVVYARAAAENYAAEFGYPVPPDCPPSSYNGECSFNFIRKPAYSFGWDWGPAVPTSGLWRPVYLDTFPGLAIEYVKFAASPGPEEAGNVWWAEASAGIKFGDGFDNSAGQVCVEAQIDEASEAIRRCVQLPAMRRSKQHWSNFQAPRDVEESNFTVDVRFERILNPQLWWPNGYGSQQLYTLRVRLCLDGPDCHQPDAWETRRVAFRRIQLLQNPVGSRLDQGLTFNLVVNDKSVFIKGSNFVPVGMAIARADARDYNWLLQSAAAVGINMLRVWGGGTIERPEFYDLADQLGIMIWQDFPFACALYPVDEKFLSTVRSEIRATVRRLQHRACLAMWVGNNENEGALANHWWPLWANRTQRYYEDYRKLYMQTVRSMVLAEDATRPVLLSSPSNGDATEWEGGVARQPQSTLFGDVHFYSYTDDMWLPETTPLSRLMSEFGFQSHPSLITVLSATGDPRNVGVDTNFTLHREHQPNGTRIIARHNARHFASQVPEWLIGVNDGVIGKLLADNYSVPPSELKQLTGRLASYAYQSYVSQLDQAEIYRRVTHQHALHRCRLRQSSNQDDNSELGQEGLSSGVMYWQLNDVWSAPTWSSIEVSGAWKATHYYAARYYANRRVAIVKTGSEGSVTAAYIQESNDGSEPEEIAIKFECHDVDSLAPLRSWTVVANWTSPNCPVELFHLPETELIKRCGCPQPGNCLLEAKVLRARREAIPVVIQPEQYFFGVPKNFKRTMKPQLTVNVTQTGSDRFRLDLTSQTPLYSIHLQFLCHSLTRAVLSDNAFHSTSGQCSVDLRVPPHMEERGARTADDVKACLLVHYL